MVILGSLSGFFCGRQLPLNMHASHSHIEGSQQDAEAHRVLPNPAPAKCNMQNTALEKTKIPVRCLAKTRGRVYHRGRLGINLDSLLV